MLIIISLLIASLGTWVLWYRVMSNIFCIDNNMLKLLILWHMCIAWVLLSVYCWLVLKSMCDFLFLINSYINQI